MPSPASLSESDLDLLVEMFCCVIAADKKVSGRELSVVTNALTSLGHTPDATLLKTKVVEHCKLIHKKGVDEYVAELLQRVQRLAAPPLASTFIEAQPTLLYADGASTPDEERVSQKIVACLTNIMASLESDSLPYFPPSDPTSSLGSSVLGTAKSSAALAAATAERTKLMTVSLPAAFLKLGRQCMTSKAFAADFPQLYASIEKLTEEMKLTAEKLGSASGASTLAGKAQQLASKGMTLALSQKLNVQYQRLMHDLGKAVYEAKGSASGPRELCDPIRTIKERIDQLGAATTASANDLKEAASSVGRRAAETTISVRRAGFLQSPLVIAIASIAFAPIGLLLIWLHPTWHRGTKAIWAAGAVACFCGLAYVGMLQVEGTRKAIAQADEMWAAGERDKAAVHYRQVVNVLSRLPKTEQASTFARLIEYEHENGDSAATQALIAQVVQRRLSIPSEYSIVKVLVDDYEQQIQASRKQGGTGHSLARGWGESNNSYIKRVIADTLTRYEGAVDTVTLGDVVFNSNMFGEAVFANAIKLHLCVQFKGRDFGWVSSNSKHWARSDSSRYWNSKGVEVTGDEFCKRWRGRSLMDERKVQYGWAEQEAEGIRKGLEKAANGRK